MNLEKQSTNLQMTLREVNRVGEGQKNVPKLRFKGYEDAWEQRKLGSEFKKVNERNDGTFGKEHWISVAKMYFQDPDKVQSNNIDTRTYVMRFGDIAFEGHPNNEFQFGRFVANDIGDGVASELFPIYRHKNQYYNNYWKYAIQQERIMAPIFAKSITSSGNSSNKLDPKHFLRQKIRIATLEEQKNIGDFLTEMDTLITLHQRKYDALKVMKKTLLSKMFPKDGETTPEIQFSKFEEDWGKIEFGNLLNEKREKTIIENEDTLLSCAIEGIYLNSELFNHFRGTSTIGYIKVKKDDLILSTQNLHLGNCNVNRRFEHGIISPAYKVYELVNCDPLFIQAWVKQDKTKDFFLRASTEGASLCRKNIVWEELYRQEVSVPNIEVQKLIGDFFDKLDKVINLHQRKLEELKNMKRTLLQQMFV